MRIVWSSDIHLNFLKKRNKMSFIKNILSVNPDIVIITGDISDSNDIINDLSLLEENLKIPFYYNLGNHDYYYGMIDDIRKKVKDFSEKSKYGKWFELIKDPIHLTDDICLIGVDGWADGRYGDYNKSTVELNDYYYIGDFSKLNKNQIFDYINMLGDFSSIELNIKISLSIEKYKNIIICTHVPPFVESCWYNGSYSNDNYLPHFSNKAFGDVLRYSSEKYKDNNFIVLCGHTHGRGKSQILPNLKTYTAESRYYYPEIEKIIDIDDDNNIEFKRFIVKKE